MFAKWAPLTDLELAHPRSTANVFDLPTCCQFFFGVPHFRQYGFGGPALNAWRELAANVIITEGELAGATESFPLLYHWRVLPVRPKITAEQADVEAVVAALEGSTAVRSRLEALRDASHSLVLFTEYIPDPVANWLREDPAGRAEAFERQLFAGVASLRDRGLLHLDLGLDNLRVDGERIRIVDFGLANSARFELSDAERAFTDSLSTYDADYAALRLITWLANAVCGMPVPARGELGERAEFIHRCASGDIPDRVPPMIVEILGRRAPAAWRVFTFCRQLFDGDLRAEYPRSRTPAL